MDDGAHIDSEDMIAADDDPFDFTAMECTKCGAMIEVPSSQANAWIAERVKFECSFIRSGGCISRLRRRRL